jgi:hypothetical protein
MVEWSTQPFSPTDPVSTAGLTAAPRKHIYIVLAQCPLSELHTLKEKLPSKNRRTNGKVENFVCRVKTRTARKHIFIELAQRPLSELHTLTETFPARTAELVGGYSDRSNI